MQVRVDYAQEHLDLEIPDGTVLTLQRQTPAPALTDPIQAVRDGLEVPHEFPALRRALTPDDHVTIIVDEQVPRLAALLQVILEHLVSAGVSLDAVTLLCPPGAGKQAWVEELPEALESVRVEVHDPTERKRLSYLATTRSGRRIYLSRTVVDADQLVVLSRRGYDAALGYSGAECAIFPALSDAETRQELLGRPTLAAPDEGKWPARSQAAETAWLLGAPFMVQIIEGAGDDIAHAICGTVESGPEALRLLDARWHVTTPSLADTVVASLSGSSDRHDFAALARAASGAACVCRPNGRIVVVSRARPASTPGLELLRQAEDAESALAMLREHAPTDAAAFQWANTARQATLYLLSDLPPDMAEELFTVPLEKPSQVQRLLRSGGSCLYLPDAHKTMAVIA